MSNSFLEICKELESFNRLDEYIKSAASANGKAALCTGVVDSQKCHLAYALAQSNGKNILFVAASEFKAKEIYDDLSFFSPDHIYFYPAKDLIFYAADARSSEIVKARIAVQKALARKEAQVIVLSVDALFDRLVSVDKFMENIIKIEVGAAFDFNSLLERLLFMGYERNDSVLGAGQFAARGGILDIFPSTYPNALRIEFFGDDIDSIRTLDLTTQRSIDKIEYAEIYPMREMLYSDDELKIAVAKINKEFLKIKNEYTQKGYKEQAAELSSKIQEAVSRFENEKSFKGSENFISYFPQSQYSLLDYLDRNTLIFFDEPSRVSQHAENISGEYAESVKARIEKGSILPGQSSALYSYADVLAKASAFPQVLFSAFAHSVKEFTLAGIFNFSVKSSGTLTRQVELLFDDIKYYIDNKYRVLLLAGAKARADRMLMEACERGLPVKMLEDFEAGSIDKGILSIGKRSLNRGFEYDLIKFVVITDKELFGERKQRKAGRKKKKGAKIEAFTDLKIGDYVVHDNHGVGIYRGIEKIVVDNISKDYLKISYRDGGNLFIHTSQMDMIQKYIGGESAKPKLSKLGSSDWGKAKSKARGAVKIIAADLVRLYAERQSQKGYSFSEDNAWQNEFEELFPYEETEDQLSAIEDVKRDMESDIIMDRLICGDDGYGKTEIAIRAAFKAVQDGKQVAYLCPTTILSQQHFNTFSQRMKDFPVNIGLLCRFRTKKEQSETAKELAKGAVDIVIGTHRLLSKDISFKNLGLIIVDEEQRFGVTHKEKLKAVKAGVDVMTLTATPIPRTLHMSLSGIRDMSILEEPPEERLPIQTYVMEYSNEFVKDAIYREISRNGQVYYLHNKVSNISEVASRIQALVPEAVVSYAHGQMSETDLENTMMDFIEGQIDVLVCTTIIETGLDIQNVNTIIVQDADKMGLSQLYQLRGRVGRSNRLAYAYLMYKKDKILTEVSEKRLQTIKEFTEFGSGFKIAMRDLEIRGAGNLLGAEQHGHMDAVGYDTYCRLLEEEINILKGISRPVDFETTIDISLSAYIPDFYIENEEQKLEFYKKISFISNDADYLDIQEEIEDRFGDIPQCVETLLQVALLKSAAHNKDIVSVIQKQRSIVAVFKPDANVAVENIYGIVSKNKGKLLFTIAPSPYLTYRISEDEKNYILNFKNLLDNI